MAKHIVDVWQHPSMVVERYTCAPGPIEGVERHVHDEYQFCLGVGVACVYRYRGGSHVVPSGGLNVLHPGEPHATSDAEPRPPGTVYHMLYIDPAALRDVAIDLSSRPIAQPYFSTPVIDDPRLLALFRGLYQAVEGGADQLEQDVRCLAALSHLVARHAQARPILIPLLAAAPAVRRVRAFLHATPTRAVSLEELAQIAGLSPFHLCRAFRREIGLSPYAYHLQVRVAWAKTLIGRGLPIVRAATEAGFADQSRFGRHFMRVVGTTPGRYAGNSKNRLYASAQPELH